MLSFVGTAKYVCGTVGAVGVQELGGGTATCVGGNLQSYLCELFVCDCLAACV